MNRKITLPLPWFAFACVALLGWSGSARAQSSPRHTPLPVKRSAASAAAASFTAAASTPASSPWQMLPNQPPVLDPVDCGPGNPLLLTDGTVILQDAGCQDWWKLTRMSSAAT